jgi:hypothetical protein
VTKQEDVLKEIIELLLESNRQRVFERDKAYEEAAYLRQKQDAPVYSTDIHSLNSMLHEIQRVLHAVPACNAHGYCVPHALAWIEKAKIAMEAVFPGWESGPNDEAVHNLERVRFYQEFQSANESFETKHAEAEKRIHEGIPRRTSGRIV